MELPATERRSVARTDLDLLAPRELAAAFARADAEAVAAVAGAGEALARAVELTEGALAAGGRLILAGAGTSGRLAVVEAAECWPTFSSRRVVALMAGGPDALVQPREGAEDDRAAGAAELAGLEPGPADLVLGIAASGRTPYVWGVLDGARAAGAKAGLLCCAAPAEDAGALDVVIQLETGPELLTGSTRLKAGTATKCALNAITTAAMARRGKVYGDLMVDVVPSNAKLQVRARRIVAELTGEAPERAAELLSAAGGVKTAVVMGRLGLEADAARARLEEADGHLRRALGEEGP